MRKIHRLSSVGSTNDLARTLIASGCQNGSDIFDHKELIDKAEHTLSDASKIKDTVIVSE